MSSGAEGPQDRSGDTAQRFCDDFARLLRDKHVSLRMAASKSHWGKTTIATAGRGPALPNRELVRDVLTAFIEPAEVSAWLDRYDRLAGVPSSGGPETDGPAAPACGPSADLSVDGVEPGSAGRRGWGRRGLRRAAVAGVVIAALIAVVVAGVLVSRSPGTAPADRTVPSSSPLIAGRPHETVVVQNKVAFGPSTLQEDRTPEYLSSRPVSRCAEHGCELSGTQMWSGTTVVVDCHIEGELLTNADIASPGIKTNPNAAASALWYEAVWPDGRRGYVSEVYLAPSYRGGMDLPPC